MLALRNTVIFLIISLIKSDYIWTTRSESQFLYHEGLFPFFFFFGVWVFACLYVYVPGVCLGLCRPEYNVVLSATGVTDDCEPPCVCWELNPCSLARLSTEPFLLLYSCSTVYIHRWTAVEVLSGHSQYTFTLEMGGYLLMLDSLALPGPQVLFRYFSLTRRFGMPGWGYPSS